MNLYLDCYGQIMNMATDFCVLGFRKYLWDDVWCNLMILEYCDRSHFLCASFFFSLSWRVLQITIIINLVLLTCIYSFVPYSGEHHGSFGLQCSWEVLACNGPSQTRSQRCLTSCLLRQHRKRGQKRWYLIQSPHQLFSLFLLQLYLILVTKPLEYPRFAWDLLLTLVNYMDV